MTIDVIVTLVVFGLMVAADVIYTSIKTLREKKLK